MANRQSDSGQSTNTLTIVVSIVLGTVVLGLFGVMIYMFLPSMTGTPKSLEENFKLEGSTPNVPEHWTQTSSSRFYVTHPSRLKPARITGKRRKMLSVVVDDYSRLTEAYKLSDNGEKILEIVVGKLNDLSKQEFYKTILEDYPSGSGKGNKQARMITQAGHRMVLVEGRSGSELKQLEVYSANESGNLLWVRTVWNIDEAGIIEGTIPPAVARTIMESVRGP